MSCATKHAVCSNYWDFIVQWFMGIWNKVIWKYWCCSPQIKLKFTMWPSPPEYFLSVAVGLKRLDTPGPMSVFLLCSAAGWTWDGTWLGIRTTTFGRPNWTTAIRVWPRYSRDQSGSRWSRWCKSQQRTGYECIARLAGLPLLLPSFFNY